MLVIANLEVGEAEVVVELGVVVLDALRLLERRDRQHVLALLVHGDAVVEERLPRARMIFLKVPFALDGQAVPVLLGEQRQADLFKDELLLEVPLLLAPCLVLILIVVVPVVAVLSGVALIIAGGFSSGFLGARRHHVVVVVVGHSRCGRRLGSLAHLAREDVAASMLRAIATSRRLPLTLLLLLLLPAISRGRRCRGRGVSTGRCTARILNQLFHVELAESGSLGNATRGILIHKPVLVFLQGLIDRLLALGAELRAAADTIRDGILFILLLLVSDWTLIVISEAVCLVLAGTRVAKVAKVGAGGVRLPLSFLQFLFEFHVDFICGAARVRRYLAGQVITGFGMVGLAGDLPADRLLFLHNVFSFLSFSDFSS